MAICATCRRSYADDVLHCEVDGEPLLADAAFAALDRGLEPGQMVGEYRVEGKLGEGGFGVVYRAVHPVIGKIAAIKILNRQFSSDPQMISRFIAEARAVNQIRHRNIIDIFGFGALEDGRQYYAMELLEGMTLRAFLTRNQRLAPEVAIPILRGIARALDAAHAAGIAHRDLKPENIFLCIDFEGVIFPKLLDFGIAKLLGNARGSHPGHKTRTGTPIGTPLYMSPEQCRGRDIDRRTDIYSFGVVTFEMLTGSLPFEGEDLMDMMFKHTASAPPAPSSVCPALPAKLDAPLLQMLAKKADDRPQTLLAGVEALVDAARAVGIDIPEGFARVKLRPLESRPPAPGAPDADAGDASDALVPGSVPLLGTRSTLRGAARNLSWTGAIRPRAVATSAVAVAVAAVAALVVVLIVHARGTAPATSTAYLGAAELPRASAVTAGSTAANGAASAMASGTATANGGAPPPEAPSEVEIRIVSTPTLVGVYRGEQKLGTSRDAIQLARGNTPVKLTLKASGYDPTTLEVVPSENRSLNATLVKQHAAAHPSSHLPRDLEDPWHH